MTLEIQIVYQNISHRLQISTKNNWNLEKQFV